MKITRADHGYQYGNDPIMPVGVIGVVGTAVKIGDGVTAWSALPLAGADSFAIPVINALSEIPYGTPANKLFAIKGAAQAAVAFRKNLCKDPKATALASFAAASGNLSLITTWRTSAVRWTRTATGAGRLSILAPSLTKLAAHSMRFKVQASVDASITVVYRPAGGSNSANELAIGSITVPAGESEFVAENFIIPNVANTSGSFALSIADAVVGQTVDITDIQWEQATTIGDFFYGGTAAAGPVTYAWDGTVNGSTSTASRTPFAASLFLA